MDRKKKIESKEDDDGFVVQMICYDPDEVACDEKSPFGFRNTFGSLPFEHRKGIKFYLVRVLVAIILSDFILFR